MKSVNLKRALTANIGAKLIALLVALFIWFSASGQQQTTRFYVVPLKLVNMPDSLIVVGNVPTVAEVAISGTKRELLYMSFRRIEVVVNLAAAAPGRFRQRLSTSNVVMRGNLDPRNVKVITPSSIDLFFELVMSKVVPVELTVTGSVPAGYVLVEAPKVEPSEVLIKGPSTSVTHMTSIPTKPVDLSRVKESFQKELEIDFDKSTYRCEPNQVVVSAAVSALGERVLSNIPPTVLFDADELDVEVSPKVVSLTLAGIRAVLDTLSSGDVSVLLDLSGKPPGRYTLVPEVIVPKGVGSYSMSVDSFTIIVRESVADKNE